MRQQLLITVAGQRRTLTGFAFQPCHPGQGAPLLSNKCLCNFYRQPSGCHGQTVYHCKDPLSKLALVVYQIQTMNKEGMRSMQRILSTVLIRAGVNTPDVFLGQEVRPAHCIRPH